MTNRSFLALARNLICRDEANELMHIAVTNSEYYAASVAYSSESNALFIDLPKVSQCESRRVFIFLNTRSAYGELLNTIDELVTRIRLAKVLTGVCAA